MTAILKNKKYTSVILLFVLFTGWWVSFRPTVADGGLSVQIFNATYGLMAVVGALFGLFIAKSWGGFKSVIGRAIIMFSFGLLAQVFGQIAYSYYYYVLHQEVPYPSIGDLGFFGSIPFYIYGAILIGRAAGVSLSMKNILNKVQAFLIPILLLAGSYWIFLRGYEFDWTNPLTVFLDFGYPFGQAIYISLAILAFLFSRKLLGGVMRSKILWVIFALFAQYLADFTFLYQIQHETWIAGGINDLMYLFAYLVMTLSILNFGSLYNKLNNSNSPKHADDTEAQNG